MITLPTNQPPRVAILGGGTIGTSWAAYFATQGWHVTVIDPFSGWASTWAAIQGMHPQLDALGAPHPPEADRFAWLSEPGPSLSKSHFVIECLPEKIDLKRSILPHLESHIQPETVISSSTSSLLATNIQAECTHPERVIVGHPFNPPHLLPLVEVVAGQQTSQATVDWTMALWQSVGKAPVLVKKEAVGHIANRLTAALFREAVHIVNEGIGTVGDVDDVITNGPGLRWAFMGSFLTYHLAGGAGGIEHFLDHLGPAHEARWETLGDPRLTDTVKAAIMEGTNELVGEKTTAELAQVRDDNLLALLKLKANAE